MKRFLGTGIGIGALALIIGLMLAGCGGGGGGALPHVPNSLGRTCVAPGTAVRNSTRAAASLISPYAGYWTGTFSAGDTLSGTITLAISNDGSTFSGSVSGTNSSCGPVSISFSGTVSNGALTFTSFSGSDGCGAISGSMSGSIYSASSPYISMRGSLSHTSQGPLPANASAYPRQGTIQCIQINTDAAISPQTASVTYPATQSFFITVYDDGCNPMPAWTTVSWSVDSAIGSITGSGVFTPVSSSGAVQGYVYATFQGHTDKVLVTVNGDTTAPTISDTVPSNGAATVAADGPTFKVIFSESMDSAVNLNDSATLSASGFGIALQRNDTGGTISINSSNALAYGVFSWMTTTNTNDTLAFTLKSSAVLEAAGLKTLKAGRTYNITSWTAPSNVTDASGNALSTTGVSATGSFTASADTTAPQVSSLWPSNGATNVASDQPQFRVYFNESMDHTVNLNNSATLSASAFSITLQKASTGASLTIDASNALAYGSFIWMSTTYDNDTLAYVLKSNSVLTGLGLKVLEPGTLYNITARTVPANLKDQAGNALNATTNIPTTGSFTTQGGGGMLVGRL